LFFLKAQKILPRKLNQLHDDSIEDDPLYDKVPSDEDYASVASEPVTHQQQNIPLKMMSTILNKLSNNGLNINTSTSNPVSTINSPNNNNNNNNSEYFKSLNRQSANHLKSQLNPKAISNDHKIVELKTNFEKINSLNTTPVLTNRILNNSGSKLNNSQEISFLNNQNDIDQKTFVEVQNENELMKSMVI
jgi:hypothetical protein